MAIETAEKNESQRAYFYRVLRYTPNLIRDEWVNIGILVFDAQTGERRLRFIEEPEEYARVRRIHPRVDEDLLRKLRNDLEDRFNGASGLFLVTGHASEDTDRAADWLKLLGKWDEILSNTLQFSPQKGVYANDLDAVTERLYSDHVAPDRSPTHVGAPRSRGGIRSYCAQVLKQARLWDRMQKGLRAEEYTFPGDPMRIDYGYRRNGTRGFLQTLSISRAPSDVKSLAYTVERIREKVENPEFTAVTDIHLIAENERHRFVSDTLRSAGVEAIPMEGFAVWAVKMRPLIR
jgi:hypothetical protein